MSLSTNGQFAKLITAYLYQTASDADIAELERLIRSDQRLLARFVQDAYLHRVSRDVLLGASQAKQFDLRPATGGLKISNGPANSQASRSPAHLAAWRPLLGGIAALLFLAVGAWWLQAPVHTGYQVLSGKVTTTTADSTGQLSKVSTGYAVIQHPSGARFAIAAPAEFAVRPDALVLRSGSLSAVYATADSRHVRVITPLAEIEDLGTELAVQVDKDGRSQLKVITGRARIISLTGTGGAREVPAGAGIALTPAGLWESLPTSVAGSPPVSRVAMAMRSGRADGWHEYVERLAGDESLLLWLDGQSLSAEGQLANLVTRPGVAIEASPAGEQPPEVAGRFASDRALRIDRVDQALAVDLPQTMSSVTLSAWVRLDPEHPGQLRHRALLLSERANEPGQVHWQLKGFDFRVSVRAEDETFHSFAAMTDALAGGRWLMLTTVIDGPERTVRHYVDGQMVFEQTLKSPLPPLTFGRSWVGGWKGARDTAGQFRAINGEIDELMVWSRPLSPVEVADLARRSSHESNNNR